MDDAAAMDRTNRRLGGPWFRASVALTLVAGLIHVFALEEHLAEWWGYATFFLFASAAQIFYAVLLTLQPWSSPSPAGPPRNPEGNARRFLWAGIVGNLLLILLYLVSRTTGLPFLGAERGAREPVTILGVLSKVTEVALVACLWVLLRVQDARQEPSLPGAQPAR